MKKTKLIYDIGDNDLLHGSCSQDVNGKRVQYPFYLHWCRLLNLVVTKGYTISPEWLKLSQFKLWHDTHYKEGRQISWSFIDHKAKHLSPATVCFIHPVMRNFFSAEKTRKADSASVFKRKDRYWVYHRYIKSKGFNTEEEAFDYLCLGKIDLLKGFKEKYQSSMCDLSLKHIDYLLSLDYNDFKTTYC